jgi:hypothetical protein
MTTPPKMMEVMDKDDTQEALGFLRFVVAVYKAVPSFASVDEADAAVVREARKIAGFDADDRLADVAAALKGRG